MQSPALLTMWEVSLRRDDRQVEWDLIILPLLFGPISITDNMLVDNRGLINALKNKWFQELFRIYVELGLFKISVRKHYSDNKPITSMDELLMIWLSRTDEKSNWTVAMGSFSDEFNEEIRNRIKNTYEELSVRERCADFINAVDSDPHGITGYKEIIQFLDHVIFKKDSNAIHVFDGMPSNTIQSRVAKSLGVNEDITHLADIKSDSKLVDELEKLGVGKSDSVQSYQFNWDEYLDFSRNDPASIEIFRQLCLKSDVGKVPLDRLADEIDFKNGSVGSMLKNVIHAAYVCGIPEANKMKVLWPNKEPHAKVLVGSSSNREKVALDLIEALTSNKIDFLGNVNENKISLLKDIRNIVFEGSAGQFGSFSSELFKGFGAVAGGTLGAFLASQDYISNINGVAAEYVIGATAGLGGAATYSIANIIYPKIFGGECAYGKYAGDFYTTGKQYIESIESIEGEFATVQNAPMMVGSC